MTQDKALRFKLSRLKGESDLKDAVIEEILEAEEIESYISDLLQHGCVSGMVGGLIYYSDTVKFYDTHESEIEDLLEEARDNSGYKNRMEMIASLNGADNVGDMTQEKNLLAWFGFEETARKIAEEIGVEV